MLLLAYQLFPLILKGLMVQRITRVEDVAVLAGDYPLGVGLGAVGS